LDVAVILYEATLGFAWLSVSILKCFAFFVSIAYVDAFLDGFSFVQRDVVS
jgi:hypothetical protein